MLLKFRIPRHLVILDDCNLFKGIFPAIYKALKINYDILAKRNHSRFLVEKFHHFIIKDITTVVEDRLISDVFIAADVTTRYAYNTLLLMGPTSFEVFLLSVEIFVFPSILI